MTEHGIVTQGCEPLRRIYAEIDEATAVYLNSTPLARCPVDCHKCCTCAAPLVSAYEWELVEQEIAKHLSPTQQRTIQQRALSLRRDLEAGEGDDFPCPLLEDGRCLVYDARPYLCRSFGQSSRMDESGCKVPYSCDVLHAVVKRELPPVFEYRIAALRRRVGQGSICDSYIPIWISTRPEQRCERTLANGCSIVVAADAHRVR